jgi:hypothetical protein
MVNSVQKVRPVDLFQRVDHVRGFDGVGSVGRIGGIVRVVRLSRIGDVVAVYRLVPDAVVGAVRPVGPVRIVVADAGHGARVSGPGPRWHCPAPSGIDARRGRHSCRSRGSGLVRPRPTSSSAFDRLAGLVAYFECVESYVNRRKSVLEVDVTVEPDTLVRSTFRRASDRDGVPASATGSRTGKARRGSGSSVTPCVPRQAPACPECASPRRR